MGIQAEARTEEFEEFISESWSINQSRISAYASQTLNWSGLSLIYAAPWPFFRAIQGIETSAHTEFAALQPCHVCSVISRTLIAK